LDSIRGALKQFRGNVEEKAEQKNDRVARSPHGRWVKILEDVKKLDFDLDEMAKSNFAEVKITRPVTSEVKAKANNLERLLFDWKKKVEEQVSSLGDLSSVDITHSHLDIKFQKEVFDSGDRKGACAFMKHYDTDLRVFNNPWSPWKVGRVHKYSIDYNGEANWLGAGQCGKGVNVMQVTLEASEGASGALEKHKVELCLLNSHQSFKYDFKHRLNNLVDTVKSLNGGHSSNSQRLQCDVTVYTSDFNSRLMCQAETEDKPMADIADKKDKTSSFQRIISEYCSGSPSTCSLAGSSKEKSDELTQFLKNEYLGCFTKDKKKWKLDRQVPNPLFNMQHKFREVGPPNFAPTYKLGKTDKSLDGYKHCLSGDATCLINESKKDKHNPAWTDRILVRDSERAHSTADFYQRRTYASRNCDGACSDHAIVAAMMSVEFQAPK
jgi:hypothetical protein